MNKGIKEFFQDCTRIITLVFADLRFEWILSLCMVLSLGAVFSPLFILLGLQEGIIGNMLDTLQRDPVSRLVRPESHLKEPLDEAWLQSLRKQTAALVESPISVLPLNIQGRRKEVTVLPTNENDPLLVENGITLTDWKTSIILSAPLAHSLAKQQGNSLTLILERSAGQEERVPLEMQIAGVLPKEASLDATVWLDARLFKGIHQWRRGGAVPELGLAGGEIVLEPEYDGIITLLKKIPSDEEYRRIMGKTGFSDPPQPVDLSIWGYKQQARLWKPVNNKVLESKFRVLANQHYDMGYSLELFPYLENFTVLLKENEKKKTLTLSPLLSKKETEPSDATHAVQHVWLSLEDKLYFSAPQAELIFSASDGEQNITIPVRVNRSEKIPPGHIATDFDFAGKMNAARRQEAVYDRQAGEFRPIEQGIRFFRAYAKSIEELEQLVKFIQTEGERRSSQALRNPVSRIAEVRNIRRLAGYMEDLYFLILGISGVSAFFAILAGVYAGIQRKRKDIAYLTLFGLHPLALILFPFLKSLMLVSAALGGSLAAYGVFGYWADRLFADALGNADSLTRLDGQQVILLVAIVYITASLASFFAAITVRRIEPGEYIRE